MDLDAKFAEMVHWNLARAASFKHLAQRSRVRRMRSALFSIRLDMMSSTCDSLWTALATAPMTSPLASPSSFGSAAMAEMTFSSAPRLMSTGRAPFKKLPSRAEGLDFRARFWKLCRPVLAYSGPFWSFWTSKIDSGWPDGSWHTKRELGSLSETRFRSFSPEV